MRQNTYFLFASQSMDITTYQLASTQGYIYTWWKRKEINYNKCYYLELTTSPIIIELWLHFTSVWTPHFGVSTTTVHARIFGMSSTKYRAVILDTRMPALLFCYCTKLTNLPPRRARMKWYRTISSERIKEQRKAFWCSNRTRSTCKLPYVCSLMYPKASSCAHVYSSTHLSRWVCILHECYADMDPVWTS